MPSQSSGVFDVQCPKCADLAKFPAAAAGKRARCPRCAHEFTLPKKGSISARVKASALAKESGVVVKLFCIGLVVFAAMLLVFFQRQTINGHYWTYGFIALAVIAAQRLREMSRIAKTDNQKFMTKCGMAFLLVSILCLGLAAKSHYALYMEYREAARERGPEEEKAEIEAALANAADGEAYIAQKRKEGLYGQREENTLNVNIMLWNTKNPTDFAKRLAMAKAASTGVRRLMGSSSGDELAVFDPDKSKDPATQGITVYK